jgi:hypothetical protein
VAAWGYVHVYLNRSDMRDTLFQMQHRSYVSQKVTSPQKDLAQPVASKASVISAPTPSASHDDLVRIFNSALLASQTQAKRDFSNELRTLTESTAFKAVLNAVRQLSCVQGINDRQAAEQIIQTFRKMDNLWGDYVRCEGIDKIRKPRT